MCPRNSLVWAEPDGWVGLRPDYPGLRQRDVHVGLQKQCDI